MKASSQLMRANASMLAAENLSSQRFPVQEEGPWEWACLQALYRCPYPSTSEETAVDSVDALSPEDTSRWRDIRRTERGSGAAAGRCSGAGQA